MILTTLAVLFAAYELGAMRRYDRALAAVEIEPPEDAEDTYLRDPATIVADATAQADETTTTTGSAKPAPHAPAAAAPSVLPDTKIPEPDIDPELA